MINDMPIEFETKKLSMDTLGEYLLEVRNQFGYTLEEVSQKTGIYEKFIHYIETGKYHLLPPGVYVLGFLKKLAQIYDISCEALLEQYKKERGIMEHQASEKLAGEKTWKTWFSKITITPKLITISGSGVLAAIAFFYIVFQVFAINKTPDLTITEPKNDAVISGTSVNVAGTTEPGITVSINGQNVFVDPSGNFHTTIGVAPGQKELKINAANKFGKNNEQVLALRVEEAQVAGAETTVPSELDLELKFTKDTKIEIEQDGTKLPSEIVPAGGTKLIKAQDRVTLTTYDAGNTKATLNGQPVGSLGKVGEKITIPFSKDAANLMQSSPSSNSTPTNTTQNTNTNSSKTLK
ncbi:MAG TPA: RodZ domain-containing protein [Patescibacteria group bacterium]|jgi:cytoskeletal protein RodZ|nr:RodZ domain-containing protein [Patescibacteria group bacterium]